MTDQSSDPDIDFGGGFIGDYFGIAACGTPVWGDTRNGNQDIFGAPLDANQNGVVDSCQKSTAVSLASLTASRAGSVVELRWRTGSETLTLGFHVYRERRGVRAKLNPALIRSASGGTTKGHTYFLVDRSAPNGAVRYRLQAVHLDGTRSWVGATSLRR